MALHDVLKIKSPLLLLASAKAKIALRVSNGFVITPLDPKVLPPVSAFVIILVPTNPMGALFTLTRIKICDFTPAFRAVLNIGTIFTSTAFLSNALSISSNILSAAPDVKPFLFVLPKLTFLLLVLLNYAASFLLWLSNSLNFLSLFANSSLLDFFYTSRDKAERMAKRAQSLSKTVKTARNRAARKLALRREELEKTALALQGIRKWLNGKNPTKIIVVPDKLVNFVV